MFTRYSLVKILPFCSMTYILSNSYVYMGMMLLIRRLISNYIPSNILWLEMPLLTFRATSSLVLLGSGRCGSSTAPSWWLVWAVMYWTSTWWSKYSSTYIRERHAAFSLRVGFWLGLFFVCFSCWTVGLILTITAARIVVGCLYSCLYIIQILCD